MFQVDQPKPNTTKLVATGILVAVLLVVMSMPRMVRALFVIAVLAAVAGAWLFYG